MSEARKTGQDVLRRLDAEVAEKVFGWSDLIYLPRPNYFAGFPPMDDHTKGFFVRTVVPSYSESVEAAMTVVEKLREVRPKVETDILGAGDRWACAFAEHQAGEYVILGQASAAILPEAICRAALHATESLSINNQKADGQAS